MTQIKFIGMMRVSDVSIADLDRTAQETKSELNEIFQENEFRLDEVNFGSTDTWESPSWVDLTVKVTSQMEHNNPKEAEMLAKRGSMEVEHTICEETRVKITGTQIE